MMFSKVVSILAASAFGFCVGYVGSAAIWNLALRNQQAFLGGYTIPASAHTNVVVPTKEPAPEASPTPTSKYPIKTLDLTGAATVYITGPIDEQVSSAADDITRLSKTNKEVYVLIDSPGGSVMDGAKVVGAIQASKARVTTICLAECLSMGFIIFEYGETRLMAPNALLMAHPAAGGVRGTLGQMQARLNMVTTYVKRMDAFIAERAGLSTQAFHDKSVSELWLDAYAAVDNKFADGLVVINGKKEDPIVLEFLKHSKSKGSKSKFNVVSE